MTRPEVPRWQVAALLLVIVATSAGVFAYSATHPAPPYCATDPGATICPPANGNITYASEEIHLAANASGPLVATNVSFHGVTFHLWPFDLGPPPGALEGVAMEPVGVNLTFVVNANASWFSPDGLFGVGWISVTNETIDAQVSVADPMIVYATQNVTPTWASLGSSTPATVHLGGAVFSWHTWYELPSASVNATATLANGTRVALVLGFGAAEYVACTGPAVGYIHAFLANSSCLEDGDAALGVAMAWTIDATPHTDLNVITLMVRVG